jgi:transposase
MQPLLTQLLNLDGVTVEDYRDLGEQIILEVEAIKDCAICPRCGQTSHNVHQSHFHLAHDLSISNRQVLLRFNRRQFKCHTCKKPFSEALDFIGERRRYTDRLAEMIVNQVIHSDTHNVARNNGLTDDEVWSMVEYISKKKGNFDLSQLRRLGMDEIALRKGQGDYVVVLVDLDKNELVGLVESRKHTDIKAVLKSWGDEVLSQIKEVSIDLSGNYRGLVKKVLPNADIVADRFHVMKLVNAELNRARNAEKKVISEIKDEVEREELQAILKDSKYAVLKPEENLTEKQKIKLEEVKQTFPKLAEMHRQKEAFRNIFEEAKDWTDGVFKMLDWLKDAQHTFQDSAATIGRWFEEISNYFESRTTSGAVEGINNRLKLIKRSGYGFRNFANFRLRCLICWHLSIS